MLAVAAIIVAALSFLYWLVGAVPYPAGDGGIVALWSRQLVFEPRVNLCCGVGLTLLIGLLMVVITRNYNLIRDNTKLPAALFGIMMLATPSFMAYLYPGLLLCLVIMLSLWFMLDSFAQPESQRNVFAVFLMLSAGTAIDYGFALFMPVFWLGMAQMRIISVRSVLASLMGIATPWIIILGLGIVQISDLRLPQFWNQDNIFSHTSISALLGTVGFTAFVGISAWLQGVIKIISYNSQSRAQISLVTVIMLMTMVAAGVDFTHISVFVPLLNCMAALMVGHLFGCVYKGGKSWIAILILMLIYLGIYGWRLAWCLTS